MAPKKHDLGNRRTGAHHGVAAGLGLTPRSASSVTVVATAKSSIPQRPQPSGHPSPQTILPQRTSRLAHVGNTTLSTRRPEPNADDRSTVIRNFRDDALDSFGHTPSAVALSCKDADRSVNPSSTNKSSDIMNSSVQDARCLSMSQGRLRNRSPKHTSRLQETMHPCRFRGVSVHYLATALLDEVQEVGLDRGAKIYEIEPLVIRPKGADVKCPIDGGVGAAYVDALRGDDCAGSSTFMLSYTWGYAVGDISDTLHQYCVDAHLDLKRTYAWICCLCINQHRVKARQRNGEVVPFEVFEKSFGERVRGIGHVVALMAPWCSPFYIKRAWCCYEMFTAIELRDSCNVTIVMPPREAKHLRDSLLEADGLNDVWRTLANLKVEDAAASVEEDRTRILSMIKRGPGFAKINTLIAQQLRTWIVFSSEGHLLQKLDAMQGLRVNLRQQLRQVQPVVNLCTEVGRLLAEVGHAERALDVLRKGRRLHQLAGTMESLEGAALLMCFGNVLAQTGSFEEALDAYGGAKDIQDELGKLEGVQSAELLSAIGKARMQIGDLDGAQQAYTEARAIFEENDALLTSSGAELLRCVGILQLKRGNCDVALSAYLEARSIHEQTDTLQTPSGAELLMCIGNLSLQQQNLDQALSVFSEARRIRHRTGTLVTLGGAELLMNVGRVKGDRADYTGALKTWDEAVSIHEHCGTLLTQVAAELFILVGDAHCKLEDFDNAVLAYSKALQGMTDADAMASVEGINLLISLGRARLEMRDQKGALNSIAEARGMFKAIGHLSSDAPLAAALAMENDDEVLRLKAEGHAIRS